MNFNAPPYRPCVGIALFNQDGKVFVGERIDSPGAWQMPQGGIDDGETLEQAAFRELQEEVGTNKAEILHIMPKTICYDLPQDLAIKHWNGRYRGQEQTWIAMRFLGQDHDIAITHSADHMEFSAWRWVKLKDTLDLIVPFKRGVYRKIIAEFSVIANECNECGNP